MKALKKINRCLPVGRCRIAASDDAGFTGTDLLVVTGTVVILVMLILPALAGNRSDSQAFQCLSNLKRLQMASLLYSNDNNDFLPGNSGIISGTSPFIGAVGDPNWVAGSFETLDSAGNVDSPAGCSTNIFYLGVNGNINPNGNPADNLLGSIGGYSRAAEIYHCPADRQIAPAYHALRVRSYSENCYLGLSPIEVKNGERFLDTSYFGYEKTSDFGHKGLSASAQFVFVEENPLGLNDGFFLYNASGIAIGDRPAANHGNSGSFSFADGHAELHPWHDAFLNTRTDYSASQQDPIWLAAHGTVHK